MKTNNYPQSDGAVLKALMNEQEAEQIAAMILYLYEIETSLPDEKRVLSFDEVLNICAKAWGMKGEEIKGKINKKIRIIQLSFLWAAQYFAIDNRYGYELSRFFGCNASPLRSAYHEIPSIIRRKDNSYYKQILQIIYECEKKSGGMIRKNFKINPNYKGITALDISDNYTFKLNSYQIGKIPLKSLQWFEKNQYNHILGYSLDGKIQFFLSYTDGPEHWEQLLLCQSVGYRFIHYLEMGYQILHPICDRCIKKLNCSTRQFMRLKPTEPRGHCFQGADNPEYKIDQSLIPLPFYQPN